MAATTTVEGQVTIKSTATLKETEAGVTGSVPGAVSIIQKFTGGTGADEANVLYAKEPLTLTPSQTLDLDLNGSMEDNFGNAITLDLIKAIIIENVSDDSGTVVEIGGDANGVPIFKNVSDIVVLAYGGFFVVGNMGSSGHCAVTAATGDILQLKNNDAVNSAKINIHIIGVDS